MRTSPFLGLVASILLPQAFAKEMIWLVNSARRLDSSSGMAYYSDANNAPNRHQGAQPQDYIDVVHGRNVKWEGQTTTGHFNSGVSFSAYIGYGANSDTAFGIVGHGTASGPGFSKAYDCYVPVYNSADQKHIHTVDGWTVDGIYVCVPTS